MSTSRHLPETSGRRSAFNSLRKMPSTFFRTEKHDKVTAVQPSTEDFPHWKDTKKPRRHALKSLLGRKAPPVPSQWPETQLNNGPLAPGNKQRPSCGPDPFVRPVPEGVRVVQHAYSPPRKATPVKAMEAARHGSVRTHPQAQLYRQSSGSLRGIQTIDIDDVDCLDDPLIDDNASPLSFLETAHHIRSRSPLDNMERDELPPRSSSLSPMSKPQLTALLEIDEAAEPSSLATRELVLGTMPPDVEQAKPGLTKEKTRSKVWSVLSGKRNSKAIKPKAVPLSPKSQPTGRVSNMDSTGDRVSKSQPNRPVAQFRPPTLHVTHPSQDGPVSPPYAQTRRFVNDPSSPFVSKKPASNSPGEGVFVDSTRHSYNSATTRTPSAATSRRSMPKRKSLAGLFGISFQKSMDKLRSNTPVPPMPEPPATPPPHHIVNGTVDDSSPDTMAFYSRNGTRSGFNLHGTMLHPDALINDVTSANRHLHNLVARMELSPNQGSDPGTPTPMRRIKSGILKVKASPPRSGRLSAPAVSPTKSTARSFGKLFDRERYKTPTPVRAKTPGNSAPSSPVKTMAKSIRNRLTPSPSRLSTFTAALMRPDSVASDMSDTSMASNNEFVIDVGAARESIGNHRSELDVPHEVKTGPSPDSVRSAAHKGHPPPPSAFTDTHFRIGSQPPTLDLDLPSPSRRLSMFSDIFGHINSSKTSMASTQSFNRSSGRNSNRDTFDFAAELEALNVSDDGKLVSETLKIAHSIEFSTESSEKALAQLEEVLESRRNSAETLGGRSKQRRSNPPFQGRLAFQMNVAKSRNLPLAHGPPPPLPLPPTPDQLYTSEHQKQPSAISFASMSSLGAPLPHVDRGHPSYFEQAFAKPPVQLPPLPALPHVPRMRLAEYHHRRISSGISIDSVMSTELTELGVAARPRLGHRRGPSGRSTGPIRGPRRGPSASSVGRSDWASQRRASVASLESMASASRPSRDRLARLGRPGIGERMFEIDHDPESDITVASHIFGTRPYSFASTEATEETDETQPVTEESETFFSSNVERERCFSIKSRPMSTLSVELDSNSNVNDTFDFIEGPSKRDATELHIFEGYDSDGHGQSQHPSTPSPEHGMKARTRHRPAPLDLDEAGDNTPGLISPSAMTEVSSLFSLDTARASNPPPGWCSHRAMGSMTSIVQVHPTIREEASSGTIKRNSAPGADPSRDAAWDLVSDLHARNWDDVGEVARSLLSRSPYSSNSPPPPLPRTVSEIEAIIAESQATYKPLNTLNATRSKAAPYALQPLETRFRSKRRSSPRERVSPLLAQFAADVVPLPLPQLPPASSLGKASAPPSSSRSTQGEGDTQVRMRVPSDVRRANLGWGRRRNSDEPNVTNRHSGVVRQKPQSATQASFPSFIAFSPVPIVRPQSQPPQLPSSQTAAKSEAKPSHLQAEFQAPSKCEPAETSKDPSRAISTAPKSIPKVASKPVISTRGPRPLATAPAAKAPPKRVKRIHVKTDSNGSPVSLRPQPSINLLRPDSAPLAARHANIRAQKRVHKTKSSPEARLVAGNKISEGQENVRAPAPHFPVAMRTAIPQRI